MRRALLLIICLSTAVVCLGLARWQWNRLTARRAANAEALALRTQSVLDLDGGSAEQVVPDRRVRVRGTWDTTVTVVLRGRVFRGSPGVQVVTLLRRTDSASGILVNRGFVPAPDAATLDRSLVSHEEGEVVVEGVAFDLPAEEDGGSPIVRDVGTSYRRLDVALREGSPVPLAPYWILQAPDSGATGWPRAEGAPELSDGPHLSYAIQWLAIAAVAAVFGVVFYRKG